VVNAEVKERVELYLYSPSGPYNINYKWHTHLRCPYDGNIDTCVYQFMYY